MITSKLGFLSEPLSVTEKELIDAEFGRENLIASQSWIFYDLYMKATEVVKEFLGESFLAEAQILFTIEEHFDRITKEWFENNRKWPGASNKPESFKLTPYFENSQTGTISVKLSPNLRLLQVCELPGFYSEPEYNGNVISQYNLRQVEKPVTEGSPVLVKLNKLLSDYIDDRIKESQVGGWKERDHSEIISKLLEFNEKK